MHSNRGAAEASQAAVAMTVAVTADGHGLRNMLMCAKAEEFEGRYYQISCANRTCPACADSLSKLTCAECRDKIPNISWLRWEAVPYTCADGREVTSNDFVKVTTSIQVFLEAFKACMGTFFGHHDRAKWQDDDWGVAWNDPTLFGKELSSQVLNKGLSLPLWRTFLNPTLIDRNVNTLVASSTQSARQSMVAVSESLLQHVRLHSSRMRKGTNS